MHTWIRWACAAPLLLTLVGTPVRAALAQETPAAPPGWKLDRQEDTAAYTPDDLPKGKVFRLIVPEPLSTGGAGVKEWLTARIAETGPKLGEVVSTNEPKQGSGGMMTATQEIRAKQGGNFLALYMATPLSKDKVRFALIVTTPESAFFKPYIPEAMKIVATASGIVKKGGSAPDSSTTTGKKTPAEKREPFSAKYTRSGAGLKPGQIAGVFQQGTMEMGAGGGMYYVFEPVLALKDGTYYEDFDVPPADFDVAAARRYRPNAWGKWRKRGDKYQTYDEKKGTWSDAEWLGPTQGAAPGDKLKGTFSSISGGGNTAMGGGTIVAVSSALTFFPDGSFQDDSSVYGSSAEPLSDSSVTVGSTRNRSGTYKLDGYTLELRYKDGRVRRSAFVYMDWKDKDSFYLDGSKFIQRGKK